VGAVAVSALATSTGQLCRRLRRAFADISIYAQTARKIDIYVKLRVEVTWFGS
jgi:hypothetical protein